MGVFMQEDVNIMLFTTTLVYRDHETALRALGIELAHPVLNEISFQHHAQLVAAWEFVSDLARDLIEELIFLIT